MVIILSMKRRVEYYGHVTGVWPKCCCFAPPAEILFLVGLGYMESVWMVDDVYVGGNLVNLDSLYETFDMGPQEDQWMFWPGGRVKDFCKFATR